MLVFPDPVGPVKSSNPLVRFSSLVNPWSVDSSKPKVPRSKRRSRGSNKRITIFSPRVVGKIDIRSCTFSKSGPPSAVRGPAFYAPSRAGGVRWRGRWGHGSRARKPSRREAARVACPAWRPDPARCLGPGHWRPCRVAGVCRVAGPPAAGLPVRQAAAGLGPDLRQRGMRRPATRTGGRHRYLQALTR